MDEYVTDNIFIAVHLMAKGHPLLELFYHPKQRGQFVFLFQGSPQLKKHLRALFTGTPFGDSPALLNALLELAQLIQECQRRRRA